VKIHFTRSIFSAAALVLLANAATAQVTIKDRTPLLEVHGMARTFNSFPGASLTYSSDTLIVYRDGWSLFNLIVSEIPAKTPFNAKVIEGTSPSGFQTLSQALSSNQIGIQSGNCDIGGQGSYEYELTWYSRTNRINTLKLGNKFAPVQCTDAVKSIWNAVFDYERVLLPPGAARVEP
jgi:hypothetical protein